MILSSVELVGEKAVLKPPVAFSDPSSMERTLSSMSESLWI